MYGNKNDTHMFWDKFISHKWKEEHDNDQIETMVDKVISAYRRHYNDYPKTIVWLRDYYDSSTFERTEKLAFTKYMEHNYKFIKYAVLLCCKRHSIRMQLSQNNGK